MPETPTQALHDDATREPSPGPAPPAKDKIEKNDEGTSSRRNLPSPIPPATRSSPHQDANKVGEIPNTSPAVPTVRIPRLALYHPLELRFRPGVHLLVHVKSITRRFDGSFTFAGTLLNTVNLAGAVLLDQSTGVLGLGTTKNGRVEVLVTRFSFRGENYRLEAATNPGQKPGSGTAVELDPGKEIELWLKSASVYERSNR